MSLNNDPSTAIDSGFDVCPSCKSDNWKSAKLVVMEGTTITSHSLEEEITEPTAFSGGIRNLLLSDRWFSWDTPLEADIGLMSTTGLVEEVKRLMVANSPKLHVSRTRPSQPKRANPPERPKSPERPESPEKPESPNKTGFFDRITPVKPTLPVEPKKPEMPKKPLYEFLFPSIIIIFMVVIMIIYITITNNAIEFLLSYAEHFALVTILAIFILSFYEIMKFKKEYKDKLIAHTYAMKEHQSKCEKYEKDLQLYKLDCTKAELQEKNEKEEVARYEIQLAKYKKKLADFEAEYEKELSLYEAEYDKELALYEAKYEKQLAEYNKQLAEYEAEYEAEKNNVMKARELLWEKARICMRCGTAYLGK